MIKNRKIKLKHTSNTLSMECNSAIKSILYRRLSLKKKIPLDPESDPELVPGTLEAICYRWDTSPYQGVM